MIVRGLINDQLPGIDWACSGLQVCTKCGPDEKVGVQCLRDGVPAVRVQMNRSELIDLTTINQ